MSNVQTTPGKMLPDAPGLWWRADRWWNVRKKYDVLVIERLECDWYSYQVNWSMSEAIPDHLRGGWLPASPPLSDDERQELERTICNRITHALGFREGAGDFNVARIVMLFKEMQNVEGGAAGAKISALESELAQARAEAAEAKGELEESRAEAENAMGLPAAMQRMWRVERQLIWKELQRIAPWAESNDMDWIDEIMCGLAGAEQRAEAAEAERDKYREALRTIQGWDCLAPEPATHLCSDFPWLKQLITAALAPQAEKPT